MHRQQLEHIIRAAAGITGASEFVIIDLAFVRGLLPHGLANESIVLERLNRTALAPELLQVCLARLKPLASSAR